MHSHIMQSSSMMPIHPCGTTRRDRGGSGRHDRGHNLAQSLFASPFPSPADACVHARQGACPSRAPAPSSPLFPRVEKPGVRTGVPNAQPTLLRNRRPSLEPLGAPDTTRRQAAAGLSCTWSDPPSPQLLSLASAPPLLYVCK